MENIKKFDVSSFPNSSFSIILGRRRSGKTVLAEDFIRNMCPDCCFLFSGTDAGFNMISKENRFNDIGALNDIIQNYTAMNEYNKVADPPNKFKVKTLIVIDDLVLKLKGKEFNKLQELSVNGRHVAYAPLCLHIMILGQNLTSFPRIVRNNVDMMIFNNISSMKELELVMDEFLYITDSSRDGKKIARKLYNDLITKEDFSFIVVENHKQNIKTYQDYIRTYVAKLK